MSLSDDGIADSDETSHPRGAMPRVMASLAVAFFAYLGLLLGGGFGTFASTETNNFSSAKGSQQPHYLALRDNTRGIVAAQRDVEPKASWHDGNAGLITQAMPSLPSPSASATPVSHALPQAGTQPGSAYLAQGPPAISA